MLLLALFDLISSKRPAGGKLGDAAIWGAQTAGNGSMSYEPSTKSTKYH